MNAEVHATPRDDVKSPGDPCLALDVISPDIDSSRYSRTSLSSLRRIFHSNYTYQIMLHLLDVGSSRNVDVCLRLVERECYFNHGASFVSPSRETAFGPAKESNALWRARRRGAIINVYSISNFRARPMFQSSRSLDYLKCAVTFVPRMSSEFCMISISSEFTASARGASISRRTRLHNNNGYSGTFSIGIAFRSRIRSLQ